MSAAAVADPALAARVAAAARTVAAAGLAQGFGHVSRRIDEGSFAITSTGPLADAREADVIVLEAGAAEREPGTPLEAPMHAAIYAARPDVEAIVRTHSPAAVAVGAASVVPSVAHGLGGLSGEVALHADPQLVTDDERAATAAATLGGADCLILRANGALAVAGTLERALVRAWFLEERARVWLEAGRPEGLSAAELAERARHWPAEAERASRWLESRFGGGR